VGKALFRSCNAGVKVFVLFWADISERFDMPTIVPLIYERYNGRKPSNKIIAGVNRGGG
jgi:hypothetical protein